ncbi:MAG: DUF192 domain-containing protein [Candidatus Saccharimonadales bacterium]
MWRRFTIPLLILGCIALLALILTRIEADDRVRVDFDAVSVAVDVADTPELRQQGLSGSEALDEDEGMLFVFNEPNKVSFHMLDMNFALDIIWLDEELKVVDIAAGITPETYPESFKPITPAKYVLEVHSGFAAQHGISLGSQATIAGL